MTRAREPYPVRVDAHLDAGLSRGLWLVKWLLLIPHFVVLAFLWLAFTVLGVVAFFAILVTARYPRALFDFNVGVLRWSWRVHYYGYGALGTDRYPPFTLADVPDYPAGLDVAYPERLSRGLVLVKWWLLTIPHYLVLAVFVGGGVWLSTGPAAEQGWDSGWAAGGLVGLLVLIAAVVLLFTGRYPQPLYDFVMGMDRWVLRVAAYAGLMTDRYPPFRLDMGGADPGSVPGGPAPTVPPADARPSTWTAGRVAVVVIGSLLLLAATGPLAAGGGLLRADQTQRVDGYLWTPAAELRTDGYALASDSMRLDTGGEQWVLDRFLGDARLQATATDPATELFIGIARSAAVDRYLAGVEHRILHDLGRDPQGGANATDVPGGAPGVPPEEADIWTASATGPGTQVLDWAPADGSWTAVVMRADGGAGLAVETRAAATVPGLTSLAVGLLAGGAVLLVAGALLVALAVHRAHRRPPSDTVPAHGSPLPPRAGAGQAVRTSAPGAPR
ncbi:DUF4389 domain-containing protein [Geodermatophilus sp. YIM 151500]|uniref:DUF4389 domain-containing protein n=1 Tax=Geodermatophilus sp. YIM 151500 TaxID=2984531 RepID=UPI0021E41453|nr:DUF4389 domain-containing protein [Geodermatophilus sp. YIM 151500]MCV2487890.1 DUF4389 domain-containing protein [Geodermatophilus sp. YIM 151500]